MVHYRSPTRTGLGPYYQTTAKDHARTTEQDSRRWSTMNWSAALSPGMTTNEQTRVKLKEHDSQPQPNMEWSRAWVGLVQKLVLGLTHK